MTDEANSVSEEERAAMDDRQRVFDREHDIWAIVFSPLRSRPRRGPAPDPSRLDVSNAVPKASNV